MKELKKRKINFNSIVIKFIAAFILFGGLLVMVTVAIQNDLAETITGQLAAGRSAADIASNTEKAALNSSLAIGVIILFTFFALFLFFAKWNRALKRMENYLIEIGKGTYPEAPLRISGGDEMGEMADVINEMKLSLVEKERLKNELALARTIQAEMLPDRKAAGKLPESCRVSAFMTPAKEVGGDLYDFFMIDSRHLGLVIADVSDKGAPAALFMATAKMCIKDHMMLGAQPDAVLAHVNNRLLESNKSGLFVTAWVAEIDLASGRMTYAAAGHPFPYIMRAEKKSFEPLESDINLVLAGFPGFEYRQEEILLNPGDRIFMFTDGLDEARSTDGSFFGKDRIKAYLDGSADADLSGIIPGMKKAVDDFAAGREQFDDLTMLCVEYTGGRKDE